MLAQMAAVADLPGESEWRHTSHGLEGKHPLHAFWVKVAHPLMPEVGMCLEANGVNFTVDVTGLFVTGL